MKRVEHVVDADRAFTPRRRHKAVDVRVFILS